MSVFCKGDGRFLGSSGCVEDRDVDFDAAVVLETGGGGRGLGGGERSEFCRIWQRTRAPERCGIVQRNVLTLRK